MAFDIENGQSVSSEDRSAEVANFRAERTGASREVGDPEDEGVFERFLDSLKLRFGIGDD